MAHPGKHAKTGEAKDRPETEIDIAALLVCGAACFLFNKYIKL